MAEGISNAVILKGQLNYRRKEREEKRVLEDLEI
jgi:hypothetical protein